MRFTRLAIAPLLAALVLAACQGSSVKLLSDPNEILAAAATSTAAATSVHVDLTADGKVALDPLGTGSATPIDLSGSRRTPISTSRTASCTPPSRHRASSTWRAI
jgi:uncharacterized lipoprotein YbaY